MVLGHSGHMTVTLFSPRVPARARTCGCFWLSKAFDSPRHTAPGREKQRKPEGPSACHWNKYLQMVGRQETLLDGAMLACGLNSVTPEVDGRQEKQIVTLLRLV